MSETLGNFFSCIWSLKSVSLNVEGKMKDAGPRRVSAPLLAVIVNWITSANKMKSEFSCYFLKRSIKSSAPIRIYSSSFTKSNSEANASIKLQAKITAAGKWWARITVFISQTQNKLFQRNIFTIIHIILSTSCNLSTCLTFIFLHYIVKKGRRCNLFHTYLQKCLI